jgi:hypothetical protein
MEPLRVRWVDRKGFSLEEWVTEPLQPIMIRRFALEIADPEGQRSVLLTFVRARNERDLVIYHEASEGWPTSPAEAPPR